MISFDPEIVGRWVCQQNGASYVPGAMQAIGRVEDGKVLGGVTYDSYSPGGSICIHVAGEPGWLTRELLWYIFDYPFNQLKINKLLGMVPSDNLAALAFDRHIGFVQEHVIAGAGRRGSDLIIMTMTREQCRWLNLRKPNHEQSGNSPSPGLHSRGPNVGS